MIEGNEKEMENVIEELVIGGHGAETLEENTKGKETYVENAKENMMKGSGWSLMKSNKGIVINENRHPANNKKDVTISHKAQKPISAETSIKEKHIPKPTEIKSQEKPKPYIKHTNFTENPEKSSLN